MLWPGAKDQTAEVFVGYHPGVAHALLGRAA
jgi:hypothetical protein